MSGGAPCSHPRCIASSPEQRDIDGAIHGRCCALQDADDRIGIGGVLEKAALEAVAENDLLPQVIVQLRGNGAAQHRVEDSLRSRPLRQLQAMIAAITIMLVEVVIRGDHAKPAVAVAHRNRNRPQHRRMMGEVLIRRIRDVVVRRADVKDRVEQQWQRASARSDDQVRLAQRALKSHLRSLANAIHAHKQQHAQRD